jgi:multidrug efflux pump subunit AcrA (membrane-fusion protein)
VELIDRENVKKQAIRKLIVAFVLVMAGLTFFSNTLVNLSLPQVTVVKPAPGALSHEIVGTGTVEAAETADLYVTVNWPVAEVSVKVGDTVTAGQSLVALQTQDAENTLQDNLARLEQRRLNLQKLQETFVEATRGGSESQLRGISRDIDSLKLDLQIQERSIANSRDQLDRNRRLVSPIAGIVTEVNAVKGAPVQGGKAAVRIADLAQGQLLKAIVPVAKAQYVKVGDKTDIVFAGLNSARIQAEVTEVRDVAAGTSGGTGGTGAGGGSGGSGAAGTAGTAGQGSSAQDMKQITFALWDERLKGGESGDFDMKKTDPPSPLLLPNDAVRVDDSGYYALVVKETKAPLGSEYVLQRANLQVGDADDSNTVIVSGVTPADKVVSAGDKPVSEGDRVLLAE